MKKLLLSLMIVGTAISVSAQDNLVKFGIKAGVTLPKIAVGDGEALDLKFNTSFYIGGTVDFPVGESFSVQSGLTFLGKGVKATESTRHITLSSDLKFTDRLWYLEVPVNALFKIPAGNGNIFLGGGPYFGYAISGKSKVEGVEFSEEKTYTVAISEDAKFGKDGDFKRGDFGVNFLAGYQLSSGLNIHAGYGLGLTNIAQDSNQSGKNRVLSVGLGFSF